MVLLRVDVQEQKHGNAGSVITGVVITTLTVKAMTGKGAIKAFTERYKPVRGWFLGDPEDITDKVQKEAEEAEHNAQK